MRAFFFCVLVFFLVSNELQAQDKLISFEKVQSFTIDDLKARFKELGLPTIMTPIRYPVDVYELRYQTKLPNNIPVRASGLYFVPVGCKYKVPTLQYNHGTASTPRAEGVYDYNGESDVCIFFATDGYAVAWQDYIGLGKEIEAVHPYQHAESEGQSGADLLKAVREINPNIGIVPNHELFISGYSQGGHSAMAVHKFIEENMSNVFKVTASSPMSGAYDMAGVQSVTMFQEYTQPHYLPYLIYGYNSVYSGIWDGDINEIFKPPLDTLIPQYFDKTKTPFQINDILPLIPADMVIDSLTDEFKNNPDFIFTRLLEENALHNWKPEAPMQICYCKGDEEVFYMNAIIANETMKELGAKHIKMRHTGKKFNHFDCAGYSALHTKFYFDSFRKGSKKGRRGPIMKNMLLGLAKALDKK